MGLVSGFRVRVRVGVRVRVRSAGGGAPLTVWPALTQSCTFCVTLPARTSMSSVCSVKPCCSSTLAGQEETPPRLPVG